MSQKFAHNFDPSILREYDIRGIYDKTLSVAEPAKRSAGIKVADVATLVDKLKNVAKVI